MTPLLTSHLIPIPSGFHQLNPKQSGRFQDIETFEQTSRQAAPTLSPKSFVLLFYARYSTPFQTRPLDEEKPTSPTLTNTIVATLIRQVTSKPLKQFSTGVS
mmetsp:Transcript_31376/g.72223  ORF Transcript_31376/g.72223 Transcript_31376/m.72223 type:complete len:102 (-) Transcript_31376:12-317(-)